MPDAEHTLDDLRRAAADDKKNARQLMFAGRVMKWLGIVILPTGLIKGFVLAPPEVSHGLLTGYLCTWATRLSNMLEGNAIISPVWWVLRSISPYPVLTWPLTPYSLLLSSVGLFGCSLGLVWLASNSMARSNVLAQRVADDEKVLRSAELQGPPTQSGVGRDINAPGGIVNLTTINVIQKMQKMQEMREKDDKKSWWREPLVAVVASVVASVISKFLHLS
jgi:hypothetical protein